MIPYELEIDPLDPNVFLRACAAIDKALRAARRRVAKRKPPALRQPKRKTP